MPSMRSFHPGKASFYAPIPSLPSEKQWFFTFSAFSVLYFLPCLLKSNDFSLFQLFQCFISFLAFWKAMISRFFSFSSALFPSLASEKQWFFTFSYLSVLYFLPCLLIMCYQCHYFFIGYFTLSFSLMPFIFITIYEYNG